MAVSQRSPANLALQKHGIFEDRPIVEQSLKNMFFCFPQMWANQVANVWPLVPAPQPPAPSALGTRTMRHAFGASRFKAGVWGDRSRLKGCTLAKLRITSGSPKYSILQARKHGAGGGFTRRLQALQVSGVAEGTSSTDQLAEFVKLVHGQGKL